MGAERTAAWPVPGVCFYCGADLGRPRDPFERYPSCGERACEREARAGEREDREARAERAAADDFERY